MYFVGVDLGGTNIAIGLVDENGKIIRKDSIPTMRERSYQEIIKDMAQLILKIVEDEGLNIKDIKGIGIGTPGTPNIKEGTLIYASNFNFKNAPFRAELQKYINLPVNIDNDGNCAAIAEGIVGAAKGIRNFIMITLGTGVGGGIVINGKSYSGFNYAAAEVGHMVISMDGNDCTCGKKGCWEAYASGTALIKMTIDAANKNPDSIIHKLIDGDLSNINAKTAFDAWRQGDKTGTELINTYLKYLSEGLINLIDILGPEVIVIGGGISKEGDNILNPLRKIIKNSAYCVDVPSTELRMALTGNDAGIIGAAMLCLD